MILRILVMVLWLVWFAVYWRMGAHLVTSIRCATSTLDRVVLFSIAGLSLSMTLMGLAILTGFITAPVSDAILVLGTVLFIGGVFDTFYCRLYLGAFWRAETAVQSEHRIVDTGPYRVVRHPIYTGATSLTLGAALVFATAWNLIAAALISLLYVIKTADEDRFLMKRLPGYVNYSQTVCYRLIPFLW